MSDLISRQAAIDELKRYFHDEYYQRTSIQDCMNDFIEDVLTKLPSVQPMRKKGEWIDDGLYGDNFPHHAWLCSECGEGVIEIDVPWYKFCPNCGADMRDNLWKKL